MPHNWPSIRECNRLGRRKREALSSLGGLRRSLQFKLSNTIEHAISLAVTAMLVALALEDEFTDSGNWPSRMEDCTFQTW